MPRFEKMDLSSLLGEVEALEDMLGLAEANAIQDARMLLQVQFPTKGLHMEEAAYVTRSTQVQEKLINLLSRLSYIHHQLRIEKESYYGRLLYREEYEGNKGEKEMIALSQDGRYRDLCMTLSAFEASAKMVDSLLWSVKGAMAKIAMG